MNLDFILFKNYISLSLILVIVLTGSTCQPNEGFVKPDFYKGSITAQINEANWTACPYTLDGIILAILADYYDMPSGRLEQSLSIHLPSKTGSFEFSHKVDTLEGKAFILFTYSDADLALADYTIPPGKDNGNIQITSFDPSDGRITGNFDATLYLYKNYDLDNAPDSLVITQGVFETWFSN